MLMWATRGVGLVRTVRQVSYKLENKVVALTRELAARAEEGARAERERRIAAEALASTRARLDMEKRTRETADTAVAALTRERVHMPNQPRHPLWGSVCLMPCRGRQDALAASVKRLTAELEARGGALTRARAALAHEESESAALLASLNDQERATGEAAARAARAEAERDAARAHVASLTARLDAERRSAEADLTLAADALFDAETYVPYSACGRGGVESDGLPAHGLTAWVLASGRTVPSCSAFARHCRAP
jgi:chromosome segregation ATPase